MSIRLKSIPWCNLGDITVDIDRAAIRGRRGTIDAGSEAVFSIPLASDIDRAAIGSELINDGVQTYPGSVFARGANHTLATVG